MKPRSKSHRNKLGEEILGVIKEIDHKLGHLIRQIREDLYVLAPRDEDQILGGRLRRKRRP